MANVPGPDPENQVWGAVFESDYADGPLQNLRYALSRSIKRCFPAFLVMSWILLGLAVAGFVTLHLIAGLHWVAPDLWLGDGNLDELEQKLATIWSRVGGWVIPLAYFVWQVISTRRE